MLKQLLLGSATVCLLASGLNAQFPQPAPEHAIVAKDVGHWDAKVSVWMGEDGKADPSLEPQVSKGTETNRKLGEFWVIGSFKGEFAGMPFEGHSISGFDPKSKKFVGSWVDSFSPNTMHMIGTFDEETQTLTSTSKGIGMDGEEVIGKTTVTYEGRQKRTMVMYEMIDGKEVKSMEIVYTRANRPQRTPAK